MRKYYHFETKFRTVKEGLTQFLKENCIYYELSQLNPFCGWHFEIFCNDSEANQVNKWIDDLSL